MSYRDLEPVDITTAYEHFARAAIDAFNESKEFAPELLAISIDKEPGTIDRAVVFPRELVALMHHDEVGKEALMCLVDQLLNGEGLTPRADMVVHISEVWLSAFTTRANEPMSERARALATGAMSPEDDPEGTEALAVHVHTAGRTHVGLCPITGTGPGRRVEFAPLMAGTELHGELAMQDRASHETH